MRSISLWVLPGKTTWSSLNSHPMFSYSSQKLGEGYGLSRSELGSINWSWVGLSLFGLKIGVTTTELFKVNTDAACALLQRRSLSSWWIFVLCLIMSFHLLLESQSGIFWAEQWWHSCCHNPPAAECLGTGSSQEAPHTRMRLIWPVVTN
jgi:hypothetical protein